MKGINRYERVRVLGSGTFGQAWLVRDKSTKKQLVLKEIKCANRREVEEALTEAKVHSQLEHPHIVKYHDVFRTSSKLVHIVMEFAGGGDLQAKLTRNKISRKNFDESELMRYAVQLCEALNHLHNAGMIHRDIKLANLFLDKDDMIKLGDFGITRVLERNAARVSARTCNTPVGTPMYMAPELAKGQSYGQKADVWAMGCCLYELATGKPAFTANSMQGLMNRIRSGRYAKIISTTRYSPEVIQMVYSMLEMKPQKRPSVQELLESPLMAPLRDDIDLSATRGPNASDLAALKNTQRGPLQIFKNLKNNLDAVEEVDEDSQPSDKESTVKSEVPPKSPSGRLNFNPKHPEPTLIRDLISPSPSVHSSHQYSSPTRNHKRGAHLNSKDKRIRGQYRHDRDRLERQDRRGAHGSPRGARGSRAHGSGGQAAKGRVSKVPSSVFPSLLPPITGHSPERRRSRQKPDRRHSDLPFSARPSRNDRHRIRKGRSEPSVLVKHDPHQKTLKVVRNDKGRGQRSMLDLVNYYGKQEVHTPLVSHRYY